MLPASNRPTCLVPDAASDPAQDRAVRRAAGARRRTAAALAALVAATVAGPALAPAAAASDLPVAHDVAVSAVAEVRAMVHPVAGTFRHTDDWGAPRSGGRAHAGNDLMAPKLTPLLAVADGTITRVKVDDGRSLSGNYLVLTDREGWSYWYMHLNNDTPGTDDGRNPLEWAFVPGIKQGSRVVAGQHLSWVGDSGNAEGTAPHAHFEIRKPDGTSINPYPSVVAAPRRTAQPVRAVVANPKGGYYTLTARGAVAAYDGAPQVGSPVFGSDAARGLAVMPDGKGYVVLDAFGGLHRFGSATALAGLAGPYWPGHDIARGIVVTPSGKGLAVLDGFGGLHVAGDAPRLTAGYWPGRDVAQAVAVTASGKGYYVLDAFGGVHVTGDARKQKGRDGREGYWLGWDIARGLTLTGANGYAVLDGFGGVWAYGDAPAASASWWQPADVWSGLAWTGSAYTVGRRDGLTTK